MVEWLKNCFSAPHAEIYEKLQLRQLIQVFSLAALPLTLLLSLPVISSRWQLYPSLFVAILCIIYISSYILARLGRTLVASLMLTLVLWLLITVLNFWIGGLNLYGLGGYIVVIIIASFLFGNHGGIIFFVLSLISSLGYLAAELNGVTFLNILPPTVLFRWSSQLILFIVIASLLIIAFRALQKALERAAQNKHSMQRRAIQIQVAAQVARDATTASQLAPLLNRAVELISERFGFYHTAIFLNDDRNDYTILKAASSEAGRRMLNSGHRLKIGEMGIVGHVAKSGEPRIALDVSRDNFHLKNPLLLQTRSEMAVPLKINANGLGVLDIQSQQQQAFDDEDAAILQILADQLAVAIETTRLFEAAQRQLRELTTLHAVSTASIEASNEDELIERVTHIIGDTFHPKSFGLILVDRSTARIIAHPSYHIETDIQIPPLPLGKGITGIVALTGQPMRISDVLHEPAYFPIDPQTRSELCVPLKINDQVIGLINIESSELDFFSENDEVLLITLADQLAAEIQENRLFAASQRQLQELTQLRQASQDLPATNEQ